MHNRSHLQRVTINILENLELAEPGEPSGELNIDILVGSDHYWDVATGRVIHLSQKSVKFSAYAGTLSMSDQLIFDFGDVCKRMKHADKEKYYKPCHKLF